ncbi:CubicO group peptidase (beta-lactamase class C family) [Luteibacter sp. Sphag1AF]|uniref:serine hydrolase domain-containing protein n=1 Tax=Luteibacter sp. Sphag1AF TaxID=2587031 RepID=UPI001620A1EE|nr:serine hydrolase domain-containing protein [Luteibacter sp. Sphag1AF]MBB3228215.1 CubicO group peptidase (beta-lactamase class C family) [Luteibacter sp. Sphag1AF]
MNAPSRTPFRRARRGLASVALVLLIALPTSGAGASPATTSLPDTPAGKLGSALIQHINTDTPAQIRQWAAGVMSPSIGASDKADTVESLALAARDSGGVSMVDVASDPRQPGLLQLIVKDAHGQRAMIFLAPDPAHPELFGQLELHAADDPALYAGWPKGPVSDGELARLVHNTLDQLVRTSDFSGCVTIANDGKTLFDECRGLAERNFSVPVDQQTKFHIGSINKMFTAVAIAQLVEAGKLSWNTTLADCMPEYPDQETARKVTVWQLLHHTAGLGDFLVPAYFEHREAFVNPVDYLDLIARQPKVAAPGASWNYSNAGYMLLGRIIETTSHENYDDYMQKHVFAPAGMRATGFDRVDEVTPKLAVGYFREGPFSTAWKADWLKIGLKGGAAGGGYSTNADLLRFAAALREGKLVSAATLTKMFDDQVPAGPGGYAAGFGDRLSHGLHIRGHAGGTEGTDANMQMVWGTKAAVALTSNEGPGQNWFLAERIADLLAAANAAKTH